MKPSIGTYNVLILISGQSWYCTCQKQMVEGDKRGEETLKQMGWSQSGSSWTWDWIAKYGS